MLWMLAAIIIVLLCYWFAVRSFSFWTLRGVKQGNPYLFGNSWGPLFRKQSWFEMIEMFYKIDPEARYIGCYQFTVPTLIVRDPELIKRITVKDFDHFVDHRTIIPEDSDPLWAGNLFALRGQKWRDMRSTLSPAFTSSKMKYMFCLISQCGQRFVDYFLEKDHDIIKLEMKDTFTRFTNDVIANTAFGVECDSLKERNNEFYLMGTETTNFSRLSKILKILGYLLFPTLYKFVKLSLFPREVSDFFQTLIKTNIESREKHGIVRPDMIHLMLEARKNRLKSEESQIGEFATVEETTKNYKSSKTEITDHDIMCQALIFFFAGFHTVSSMMCFISYELAINTEIQQRLIQEVDDTMEACQGKVTYEGLLGMKYMDMVVSEALRKWPISILSDRICTKPYTIRPKYPDEKPLHLEKNSIVWIPTYALHRDPQYYPNPDRFDPERFSDENREKIVQYAYIPFGIGPRNCIGSRFALLETKILFFYILAHFEIVPIEKTQIPLKMSKKEFSLAAESGFWLGLKRRK